MVSTNDAGTPTVRDRHVRSIAEKGRMAWQKATGYGRRSLVETAMGRTKHIIGPTLPVRSPACQQNDVVIAIQILKPPDLYCQGNPCSLELIRAPDRTRHDLRPVHATAPFETAMTPFRCCGSSRPFQLL